jgi:hypothetical protein
MGGDVVDGVGNGLGGVEDDVETSASFGVACTTIVVPACRRIKCADAALHPRVIGSHRRRNHRSATMSIA